MGPKACQEYAQEVRRRYARADRKGRSQLLDELVAIVGYHRKYAIALMRPRGKRPKERVLRASRFAPAVTALIAIWRAADYPWSCRLAALLPLWMPWVRKHLDVDDAIEQLLLSMSPRSIDRALRKHRQNLKRRLYGRTKPGTLLKHQIPIRSERWDVCEAGWCETDTVAHCGESGDGEFAFSVNMTDVASTWTETRAVLGKGQRFVVAALDDMRSCLPFLLRGIDSDTGSEFINYHCVSWCTTHDLEFTRSRPYHKNDNAHIEQKNWTHVRKIFGWKRVDSPKAIEAMNALYRNELRLFMNYFQPSVKLIERTRIGSRVRRKYDKPKTPFERLVELGALTVQRQKEMTAERARLDPFALGATIEAKVREILSMPYGPLQKRARPRPNQEPAVFAKTASALRLLERREKAPVRTHAAR
jgi:hypothetical protein